MRLMLLGLSVLLPLALARCAEPPRVPQPSAKDFTLQATPVEVLEGGPVVLRLVLTYQGDQPINIEHPLKFPPDACTLPVPKGWKRPDPCIIVGGMAGPIGGFIPVKKGDQFATTVYVHEKFTLIPSGRVTLKPGWWVSFKGPRGEGGREEEVTTTLDLDVPPATPENVAAVRERIETEMKKAGLSDDEKHGLLQRIINTKHRAFVPTALRMFDTGDRDYVSRPLLHFVYAHADNPAAPHAHFVDLLVGGKDVLAASLFA